MYIHIQVHDNLSGCFETSTSLLSLLPSKGKFMSPPIESGLPCDSRVTGQSGRNDAA